MLILWLNVLSEKHYLPMLLKIDQLQNTSAFEQFKEVTKPYIVGMLHFYTTVSHNSSIVNVSTKLSKI